MSEMERTTRVFLMADFNDGKGPRFEGSPMIAKSGHYVFTPEQERKTKRARRWWLVEADSAEAARTIIVSDFKLRSIPSSSMLQQEHENQAHLLALAAAVRAYRKSLEPKPKWRVSDLGYNVSCSVCALDQGGQP